MTNSAITSTKQSAKEFIHTAGLIETVAYYQKKIEKSRRQLLLIARSEKNTEKEEQAEAYLLKQNKLAEIATELKNKMIVQIASGKISKSLETQFTQEVDILNYMHFEITKTYFAFINNNFEARVISLQQNMAA